MDKKQYQKFHKKVKALGIAMMCVMGATLIYVVVGVAVYSVNALPLIIGLPIFLSLDITLLVMCYLFSRKDKDMRTELSVEDITHGSNDIFSQLYRDFRINHLESVWDSITPNGWKFTDVYEAEDSLELILDKRVAPGEMPQTITIQFDKAQVIVFYEVGDEQQITSRSLTNGEFADFATLVIWLGEVCEGYAHTESK